MIATFRRITDTAPKALITDALGLAVICGIFLSTLFLPGLV